MKANLDKIQIGDSGRGYDTAEVRYTERGSMTLHVADDHSGRLYLLRRAVAAHNRGEQSVRTNAGDYLPIHIIAARW